MDQLYIVNKYNYMIILNNIKHHNGGYMNKHKSQIFNLRKFHNWIKLQLLTSVVEKTKSHKIKLLDLSVGRGGDIHKWNQLKINKVVGIDIDEKSIEEAKRRYHKKTNSVTKLDLHVFDLRNYDSNKYIQKNYGDITFDIVSCQFALHYFFESKDIFDNLIKMVSRRLKNNGFFIGTTLNGKKIKELLCDNVKRKLLSLNKYYHDESLYGQKYGMKIGQINKTGTSYFDVKGESIEYLVDIKEMIRVCKKYDLKLIEIKSFRKLYDNYKTYILSKEEKQISFLYFSFIFKKKG